MGVSVLLKVKDKEVKSTEITYSDLVILYEQYIETYGEVPLFKYCDSKHNMPQGRIINKVLADEGITYNDFLLKFGKVSHVRTESKDYDLYVKRFKEKCEELGRYMCQNELINNSYGLPNSNWFIKHCPNKEVKTYLDFVRWCGYEVHYSITKEYVAEKMTELEKQLNRPLLKTDINYDTIGFSLIVLNRLYGGLTNAKEEIGLMKTPTNPPKPFDWYKRKLDVTLDIIYEQTGRKIISWNDIENPIYNIYDNHCDHKSLSKSFKDNGFNVFAYIKSKGFDMTQNDFSYTYIFDNGERVVSTFEFDFSTYLRQLGFEYDKTYFRDVLYSSFSDENSKINCDYKILIGNKILYVEVAGIIKSKYKGVPWYDVDFKHDRQITYKDKMLKKEKILKETNQNYLFIFNEEMYSLKYKKIFDDKLEELRKECD